MDLDAENILTVEGDGGLDFDGLADGLDLDGLADDVTPDGGLDLSPIDNNEA